MKAPRAKNGRFRKATPYERAALERGTAKVNKAGSVVYRKSGRTVPKVAPRDPLHEAMIDVHKGVITPRDFMDMVDMEPTELWALYHQIY